MVATWQTSSRYTMEMKAKQMLTGRPAKLTMAKVYLGSMCIAVLIGWDPATPPPPRAFELIYEGAIGNGHPR